MSTDDDGFDWAEYENESQISVDDIWVDSQSFYENTANIISRTCYHSEIHTLKHILSAYTCFHSIAAKFAPILFFSGASGTGKSNLTLLMASLRGAEKTILGGSSTFASVRNTLNRSRWKYYSAELGSQNDYSRANEKVSMLFWADIKASNLADPKMYGLLRNGSSRFEDKLTIAGEDGKNLEFFVFCPKVLSSIEDFYTQAKYSELKRRLLVFRTEKLPSTVHATNWLESSINPNEYSFKGCCDRFLVFWSADRLRNLAQCHKSSRLANKLQKKQWSTDAITAYSCLIHQHIVMLDSDTKSIIEIWEKYLDLQEVWGKNSQLSIDSVIKSLLAPVEAQALQVDLVKCQIKHRDLCTQLASLRFANRSSEIPEIMNILGYSHEFVSGDLIWFKELR